MHNLDYNNSNAISNGLCTGIEIELFEYSYIDRVFLHELKKRNAMMIDDHYIIVAPKIIREVLDLPHIRKYIDEYDHHEMSITADNINSLYFIKNLIDQHYNMLTIKIDIIKKRVFTRVRGDTLSFRYKIITTFLNLNKMITNPDYLKIFLLEMGWDEISDISTNVNIFLDKLFALEDSEFYKPVLKEIVDFIIDLIPDTVEKDNPILLIKI